MKIFRNKQMRIAPFLLFLIMFPVWCSAIDIRNPDDNTALDSAVLTSETQPIDNTDAGTHSNNEAQDNDTTAGEDGDTHEDNAATPSDAGLDSDADSSGEIDEDQNDAGESQSTNDNGDNSSYDNGNSDASPSDNEDDENSAGDEEKNTGDSSGDGDDSDDSGNDNPVHPTVEIHATDIDVGDVTPVIVGTSQVLSVTLIPVNSTDTIAYTSLTPDIASVNQLGRVRGLAIGTARIQISAGEITQVISISVVQEETG